MAIIKVSDDLGRGFVLVDGRLDMPHFTRVPEFPLSKTELTKFDFRFDTKTLRYLGVIECEKIETPPTAGQPAITYLEVRTLTVTDAFDDLLLFQITNWNARLENYEKSPFRNLTVGEDVVYGNKFADILELGNSNDLGVGNAGDDRILGQSGSDCLMGGAGEDMLIGGVGADFLYGGKDNLCDVFVFGKQDSGTGAASDIIFDFDPGEDTISLASIDANAKRAGDQSFTFAGKHSESYRKANAVWYVDKGKDILLRGDTNGDEIIDFEIVFKSTDKIATADFIL